MPIFTAKSIPAEVRSSTKGPEIAAWLKTGPVLGAHKPFHVQRREHDDFIDKNPPPIGRVEHLGLPGPHGTIPVRVYHPSGPGAGGALVYLHGGGFAAELGIPPFDSPNGRMMEVPEGSATLDLIIRAGQRRSVFHSYLEPVFDLPNLTIVTSALVARVLFAGAVARSVEVIRGNTRHTAEARCEIILLLGAVQRTKPSWFVIASNDRAVSPQLQAAGAVRINATTITVPTSHLAMPAALNESQSSFESQPEGARQIRPQQPHERRH